MKKRIMILLVLVLFVLFSISCELISNIFNKITSSIDNGSTEPGIDYVIYEDFSSNKNNWAEGENDGDYADAHYEFVNGVFVWTVYSYQLANVINWPDMDNVSNFTASVMAKQTSDNPDDCDYGLIYRNSDGTSFLSLGVSNQDYSIYSYSDAAGWTEIIPWTTTSGILVPGSTNELKMVASNGAYTFYANGQVLTEFSYSDITSGQVGLNIDVFPENATCSFEFDDFWVTTP